MQRSSGGYVCGNDHEETGGKMQRSGCVGLIVRCSVVAVCCSSGVLQRVSVFLTTERGDSSGRGYYFVPVGKLVFSFSIIKQGCVP